MPPGYFAPFPTCEECTLRIDGDRLFRMLFVGRENPAEPLEERFSGMFNTASALLRKRADEETVLTTLGVEALIVRDQDKGGWKNIKAGLVEAWKDPRAWQEEQAKLRERISTARPVRVVGESVLFERVPVVAKAAQGEEGEIQPQQFTIEIFSGPDRKPPSAKEIAAAYEEALEKNHTFRTTPQGGLHESSLAVSLDSDKHKIVLHINPVNPPGLSMGEVRKVFPSPHLVEDYCNSILSGSVGKRLTTRARGASMDATGAVPAVVAFFLRTYGGLSGRKAVHELLNEYVLSGAGRIPTDEADENYDRRVKHLWQNVKRIHPQLIPVMHSL